MPASNGACDVTRRNANEHRIII